MKMVGVSVKRVGRSVERIVALVLAFALTIALSFEHSAAFGTSDVEAYGFTTSSGFTYQLLYNSSTTFTYKGKVIGRVYYTVIKASSTTTTTGLDGKNRRTEVLLVRAQMAPDYADTDSLRYLGLNSFNRVKMSLQGSREYIDMGPEGTMPSSQSSYTAGVGAEIGGKDKFKFSISTGYSSTSEDNCVRTHSSFYSDTTFDADYTYTVWSNCFTSKAKRAANQWATNKHNCYYAFVYTTPTEYYYTPTSYNNYGFPMEMVMKFRFRVAEIDKDITPSQWGGDVWDVNKDSSTSVETAFTKTIR
ncbi:MAG: hypothetical protein K6B39_07425 [Lachnospiraceae bacterium]|nr:hypothetical protein [Lachnospiraceae bacterium]